MTDAWFVNNPSEVLGRFLDDRPITQEAFADLVGVEQCTVSKWVKKRATPSLKAAIAIERETGIPVESWGGKLAERIKELNALRRRVA